MSKPKIKISKTKRTRWIAERRLERGDAAGGIVVVRVGSPEWPPGAEEWRCPYIILGLGDDSIQFGKSIDSMAALQNALSGIRSTLVQSGVPLRWEGFDENITGFQMAVPFAYGLGFQQHLEKMIEAEMEERARLFRELIERREREERERRERREARRKTKAKPQPK